MADPELSERITAQFELINTAGFALATLARSDAPASEVVAACARLCAKGAAVLQVLVSTEDGDVRSESQEVCVASGARSAQVLRAALALLLPQGDGDNAATAAAGDAAGSRAAPSHADAPKESDGGSADAPGPVSSQQVAVAVEGEGGVSREAVQEALRRHDGRAAAAVAVAWSLGSILDQDTETEWIELAFGQAVRAAKELPGDPLLVAKVQFSKARSQWSAGRTADGLAQARLAYLAAKAADGGTDPRAARFTAAVAFSIGCVLEKTLGDVQEGEAWYHAAHDRCTGAWTAGDDLFASVLYNRGVCLQILGRLAESEALLRAHAQGQRAKHGEASLEHAAALSALAGPVRFQAKHAEAAALLQHALTIADAAVERLRSEASRAPAVADGEAGTNGDALAEARSQAAELKANLGSLMVDIGELDRAVKLLTEARAVQEELHGARSLHVATTCSHLTRALSDSKRLDEAAGAGELCLSIREEAYGEHSVTARALGMLASVYLAQGRFAKARELNGRALRIVRATQGNSSPAVAKLLNNVGVAYSAQDATLRLSVPMLREALRLSRLIYGDFHPEIYAVARNLASVYKSLDQPELAEPLLRHVAAALANDGTGASLLGPIGPEGDPTAACEKPEAGAGDQSVEAGSTPAGGDDAGGGGGSTTSPVAVTALDRRRHEDFVSTMRDLISGHHTAHRLDEAVAECEALLLRQCEQIPAQLALTTRPPTFARHAIKLVRDACVPGGPVPVVGGASGDPSGSGDETAWTVPAVAAAHDVCVSLIQLGCILTDATRFDTAGAVLTYAMTVLTDLTTGAPRPAPDATAAAHARLLKQLRCTCADAADQLVLTHMLAQRRDKAKAACRVALNMADPNTAQHARVLAHCGELLKGENPAGAAEVFASAVAMYESLGSSGNEVSLASAYFHLAQLTADRGDMALAMQHTSTAHALLSKDGVGRTPLLISAGLQLGQQLRALGRPTDAAAALTSCAAAAESMQLGSALEGGALSLLALAHVDAGHLSEAVAALDSAVRVCRERLKWPLADVSVGSGSATSVSCGAGASAGAGSGHGAAAAVRTADTSTCACPMWLHTLAEAFYAVATLQQRRGAASEAMRAPGSPSAAADPTAAAAVSTMRTCVRVVSCASRSAEAARVLATAKARLRHLASPSGEDADASGVVGAS